MKMWPNIVKYVASVDNKSMPNPGNKSFQAIKEACGDPLIVPKISFFVSVAKQVQPFMTIYQTDKLMVPFLCDDMQRMLRGLMQRFIKADMMKETNTLRKLMKIYKIFEALPLTCQGGYWLCRGE